jgi:hypothetical protein
VGKCFNCFATDHISTDCALPPKCFNYDEVRHQAYDCPLLVVARRCPEGEHDRSLGRALGHHRSAQRRRAPATHQALSVDTALAHSTSMGHDHFVHLVYMPQTPNSHPLHVDNNAGGDRMVDEPISGEQADTPMGGGPPWATDVPTVGAFADGRVVAGVVMPSRTCRVILPRYHSPSYIGLRNRRHLRELTLGRLYSSWLLFLTPQSSRRRNMHYLWPWSRWCSALVRRSLR